MATTGVLSAVGQTPLISLERTESLRHLDVRAKLEALNPGGSAKDRPALAMIQEAWREGRIGPGSVIVESSSGNMGIGLAQVCAVMGLHFICVVDSKTTAQNIRILRAYGAEVSLVTEPDPESGELLQARLKRVQELLQQHPGALWPNQYGNPANSASHYQNTVQEVFEAMDGRVDCLLVATSTCGTLRGCTDFVREQGLGTQVIPVDAHGSRIFSQRPGERSIPGIGAGIEPPLRPDHLLGPCQWVRDVDCVFGCHWLVRQEGLLVGGSSGGVFAALHRLRHDLPEGSRCALIFADRGERYLDTVYDDDWVAGLSEPLPATWDDLERDLSPWLTTPEPTEVLS
ncbi:MAG: 2,3-diaminopropionate biosynthesis protein SbnA [Acidobacteriota bacterium]